MIDSSRTLLAKTLETQEETEKLLEKLPKQTAQLSQNLPQFGKDLSRILRDTKPYQEVAKS